MQNEKIIFLDMDGVLSDFHQGVCDLFGVNIGLCDMPQPWNYAIEEQINYLTDKRDPTSIDISPATMWNKINTASIMKDFWFCLEEYKWARALYAWSKVNCDRLIISTSPGYHPKAFKAKVAWMISIFDHNPADMMIGPHKHLMAAPNRVLIDDSDANCSKFVKHGGQAILFPQPWNMNHMNAEDSSTRLDSVFKEFETLNLVSS